MGVNKRIKLAIIINCLEVGGAQKIVLTLFNHLKDYYDIYLVQIDKNIHKFYMTETISQDKHFILTSNDNIKSSPFKKILWAPLALIRLIKLLKASNIQITLSFMERANILNLLTPLQIKKIVSIRSHLGYFESKHFLKKVFINFFYKFLLKRAYKINFNSFETAEIFKNIFHIRQEKISVIYNLIDIFTIKKLSKEPIPNEQKRLFTDNTVINVGNLIYAKAQARLIRAFSLVVKRVPEARLLIIGYGVMFEKLKELIAELGLKNNIYLLGSIKNPFPYVKMSKAFVFSSLNEGFPNSLLEAMALGKPVISTDCSSGPREILAPDTDPLKKTQDIEYADFGILVPSFNRSYLNANVPLTKKEQLLAEAIIKLLFDEKLRKRYSLASVKRAEDFLPENILPKWKNLIES